MSRRGFARVRLATLLRNITDRARWGHACMPGPQWYAVCSLSDESTQQGCAWEGAHGKAHIGARLDEAKLFSGTGYSSSAGK